MSVQISQLCMEELSVFCLWEESGHSEEHFMEIVYLKQANAESIYSALVEFLKDQGLQVSNIVGMGFDEASTFSGKKTGVQARIKKVAPHALYVHCHCHLLQSACVQARAGRYWIITGDTILTCIIAIKRYITIFHK